MKYFRTTIDNTSRLIVQNGEEAYDLTAANSDVTSFADLVTATEGTSSEPDTIAEQYLAAAAPIDPHQLRGDTLLPVVPQEVWAAGVTYAISEEAREDESTMPDIYIDVYDAERPEIFFKATPNRIVNPGEPVGIRNDSDWDVPEPELALVLYRGELVGYTIGNDMSSRAIEGANPLYLPQAKVYDRCCALGPSIVSRNAIDDPHDLEIHMEIKRDGETVFSDATTTKKMERSCEELVEYYTQHNAVPEWSVLMTGTSLVPPESFTLSDDDQICIHIDGIGTLENPVVTV